MTTASKPAPAPAAGTSIVAWKDRVSALAKEVASTEKPTGGGYVSFRGGRLAIGDNYVPGDKIECVILDYVWEYTFFPNAYDATKSVSPVCYAYGRKEDEMTVAGEEPQSDSCAGCSRNEWGSDLKGGRGKACKNSRKLAILHADSLKGNIASAEVVFARLPVTSVKNFSKFATDVANVLHVPPFGVVCELSVTPNPTSQFQVNFRVVEKIENDAVMQALYERHVTMDKLLRAPYPTNAELSAQQSSRGSGGGSRKF